MNEPKSYDIAFEGYRGNRRYTVSHPEYSGVLMVAAPDDVAAIVAAAEYWQARWQSFSVYAFCESKLTIYNRKRCENNQEELTE